LLREWEDRVRTFLGMTAAVPVPEWVPLATAVLLGFLAAWTTIDIIKPSLKVGVFAALLLEIAAAPHVLALYGHYFSPLLPVLTVVLSFLFGLLYGQSEAGNRKRLLRNFLGNRVSDQKFNQLVDAPHPLKWEGIREPATAVSVALLDEEERSESVPPPDELRMITRMLDAAAQLLLRHGALITSVDGRSLHVIFAPSLLVPDHAVAAARAALELRNELQVVAAQESTQAPVSFGIGVESGMILLGALAGRTVSGLAAAGDALNFASRIALENRRHGSVIACGPQLYLETQQQMIHRPLDLWQPDGMTPLTEIYELAAEHSKASSDAEEAASCYWEAVIMERSGRVDEAIAKYRACLKQNPADAVVTRKLAALDPQFASDEFERSKLAEERLREEEARVVVSEQGNVQPER
jgi:adenylate cyclase